MAKYVHLVVMVDPVSGDIVFDGDGTREYIRRLHSPETTIFDFDLQEWVLPDEKLEQAALDRLMDLGILVDGLDYDNWMER